MTGMSNPAIQHTKRRPTHTICPTSLTEFLEEFEQIAEHGFCKSPRYRIHYSVVGDGPPIYIIPGICTTRKLYAPLAVELSRRFRVVLYNFPGIEPRDGAVLSRYTPDDYWRDLIFLGDYLGDAGIPLLANSFGTTVAVRGLTSAPERFTGAMLVAGFARRKLTGRERLMLRFLQYWPGRLRHIPGMKALSRYNHGRELDFRAPELIEFLVEESNRTPVRTAAYQAMAVDHADVRDLLPKIRQPVMVVHGKEDRLVPVRYGAELANPVCHAQIMLIDHCGHQPHLSHPELLARAAQRFYLEPESPRSLNVL